MTVLCPLMIGEGKIKDGEDVWGIKRQQEVFVLWCKIGVKRSKLV